MCQIVFVLSKMDTVFGSQQESLINVVKERLQTMVRAALLKSHQEHDATMDKFEALFSNVIIFPISSMRALYAYEMGDEEALEESGFKRLNEELLPIIIRSQHSSAILTLLHMIMRVSRIFQHLSGEWTQSTEKVKDIQDMKMAFAHAAYGRCCDYQKIMETCVHDLESKRKGQADAASSTILKSIERRLGQRDIIEQKKQRPLCRSFFNVFRLRSDRWTIWSWSAQRSSKCRHSWTI